MAHIHFNHFDASAYNNFVPEATKTARNSTFKTILIVGGIALGIWVIYRAVNSKIEEKQAKQE
jgi:hypothetical protein